MKWLLGAVLSLALIGSATAQSYPNRAVKVVVGFPPGSGPDLVARLIATDLQQQLGQPFVIDNKSGALGTIAAGEVARATPDGYTILMTTNTTGAAAPALVRNLTYDPGKDFTPVMRLVSSPMILVVKPDFPANNVKEFVEHAKKSGNLTGGYGTAGGQVSLAKLKTMGGFPVIEVPYKGIPPAVNDTVSGQVHFTFADFAVALAQINGKTLKGLGMTGLQRSAMAPDMPPIADTLPGFETILWWGLVGPAGMPPEVVDTLHKASAKYIDKPETKAALNKLGLDAGPMGPPEFAAYIKTEIVKWAKNAEEAGLKPE
jgi:tripartite-type tricarboxylate transporter receptor subunit TctC